MLPQSFFVDFNNFFLFSSGTPLAHTPFHRFKKTFYLLSQYLARVRFYLLITYLTVRWKGGDIQYQQQRKQSFVQLTQIAINQGD
jgi:hypothetical protein